jgi:hypothetical protein
MLAGQPDEIRPAAIPPYRFPAGFPRFILMTNNRSPATLLMHGK